MNVVWTNALSYISVTTVVHWTEVCLCVLGCCTRASFPHPQLKSTPQVVHLKNVWPLALPLHVAHGCAAVQPEQNLDAYVPFVNSFFAPLCGLLACFIVSDLVRWLGMCDSNNVQCGYNSISQPLHLPGSPITRPINVKIKAPFIGI